MFKIAIPEVLVTDGNLSLFLPIPLQKGKWGGKRKGWGMDAVGGAPHGHHRPRTHTFLHWPSNYLDVQ